MLFSEGGGAKFQLPSLEPSSGFTTNLGPCSIQMWDSYVKDQNKNEISSKHFAMFIILNSENAFTIAFTVDEGTVYPTKMPLPMTNHAKFDTSSQTVGVRLADM